MRSGYPTLLPLLVYAIVIFAALPLLWHALHALSRFAAAQWPHASHVLWSTLGFLAEPNAAKKTQAEDTEPQPKKARVVCVDVLRGLAIGVMIFANYGSSIA